MTPSLELVLWKCRMRVITGGWALYMAGDLAATGHEWRAGGLFLVAVVCFRLADLCAERALTGATPTK